MLEWSSTRCAPSPAIERIVVALPPGRRRRPRGHDRRRRAARSARTRCAPRCAARGRRRRRGRPRRRAPARRRRSSSRDCLAALDADGCDAAIAAAPVTDTIKEAGGDGASCAHARPLARCGRSRRRRSSAARRSSARWRRPTTCSPRPPTTPGWSSAAAGACASSRRRARTSRSRRRDDLRVAELLLAAARGRHDAARADRLPRPPAPRRRRTPPPSATSPPPTPSATATVAERARDRRARRRRAHLPLHARRSTSGTTRCWREPRARRPRRATARSCARRPTCGSASRPTSSRAARTAWRRCSSARDWDYVVGSVHFLGDDAVDHDRLRRLGHAAQSPDAGLAALLRDGSARRRAAGMYDILAHPDLVKVWGARAPAPDGDLRRFYELRDGGDRRVRRRDRGLDRRAAQAGRRDLPGARRSWRWCLDAGLPDRAVQRRARARAARLRLRRRRSSCSTRLGVDASSRVFERPRAAAGADRRDGVAHRHRLRRAPLRRRPAARSSAASRSRTSAGLDGPLRRRRPHPRGHRRAARRRRPGRHRRSTSPTPTSAGADADSLALLRAVVGAASAARASRSSTSTRRS